MSKKQKHTPGPWKAHMNYPLAIIPGHMIEADDEVQSPVALLWVGGGTHGKPRQIANAKLIAAAPDLLAACQAADSWLLPYPESPHSPHTNSLRALMDQLRAAITKATK